MKKKTRIIIMISIFIASIIGLVIYSFYYEKSAIDEEVKTKYYTENEVANLEYLLKEYHECEHSEKEKRQMAIYNLLQSDYEYETEEYFTKYDSENIEDAIKEMVDNITEDDNYYKKGKTFDYHALALSIFEEYNVTLHDRNVAQSLSEIDEAVTAIINVISILLYLLAFLYFVLVKEYKNTFLKDIIKYALSIIAVYAFNILALFITEKAINYLGVYKVRAYGTSYGPNILLYGDIFPSQLLIIFAIGVVLYLLINIKRIKKVS